MSRLIAIDPGVRRCGFAVFDNRKLVDAGIASTTFDYSDYQAALLMHAQLAQFFYPPDFLVIEHMQIYDKLEQKGDLNDLIRVQHVSGVIAGLFKLHPLNLLTPTPREWKGTLPKSVHHERIKKACPEAEPIALNTPKTYRHNVYDAIGLGLWALERIDK